jgi:hypothetical protein
VWPDGARCGLTCRSAVLAAAGYGLTSPRVWGVGSPLGSLRSKLPALAAAWIRDAGDDLIGPGIAIDETAQLKHGDATACVAPQHAGCTGQVESCVTTVFSAYVTARGQAWADFDVYMPDRWARDMPRRRAAGIPGDLEFATKPELAMRQLGRLTAAGLPVKWVAFDEVYGRSEELRKKAAKAWLSYAAIIPCDYQVPPPSGAVIRADEAVADAVLERRSCGNGAKGPRYGDRAMTATGVKGQYLLIRRLISRPDQLTFYPCWAPPGGSACRSPRLRAPAACWCARATVESTDTSQVISPAASARPCKAVRILRQVPFRCQRRNRA